ncbi:excinuclease ABC subunit C [Candidatus Parcubacteria bacterium]|nr:MAG: excinuclease ABC subunit C [Candidatus Parcubacteria bacterium]
MNKEHNYYVYILSNKKNGVLYTGVTNNLFLRGFQHKLKTNTNSFTYKYNIDKLVYFDYSSDINTAIIREKKIKKWNRSWKIKLIEKNNPDWKDLFDDMIID